MRTMNHRPPILIKVWLTIASMVVLAGAFGVYVWAEKQVDHASELRHNATRIADQLRQSSDDLSLMARTYVATGDERYRKYHQDILDIRNGKKPRPPGYFFAYWDLVLADKQAPPSDDGKAIPLLDLARQLELTDAELALLVAAESKSDDLTALEREAMRLSDSVGRDATAQRARARSTLHDENYQRAKAEIMAPINDYYRLSEQRTMANVRSREQNASRLRLIVIAVALATVVMLWRSYAALLKALGGPADEVLAQIARIGRGDFSTPSVVAPGMEGSVLAGLLDMQSRLRDLEIERAKAEDSLRASTDRLNEAQRIALIGSWHLDLPTGKLLWSDEVYRLFEIEPSRFGATYEAFLGLVHPGDRAAVDEAFSDSLLYRTPYEITHRLLMNDGRVKWVHERGHSEFDPSGKALRSTGTVQDITGKKLAEDLLHKREEEFRAVVENSPDIVCRFDKNLGCAYANPAFESAVGASAGSMAGKPSSGMGLPREVSSMWDASLRQVFAEKLPATFDFSFDTASGSRHFQARMVPEFGADRQVLSVLVVGRDISAITRGVEVLRESEQRLHAITANTPGLVFQCTLRADENMPVFTYVSEGAAALLDLTATQIQGQRDALAQALLEPDREAFWQSLLVSARAMQMWNWEGRARVADGTEKWINCRATPRLGRDGEVIWEGVMLNVTASKRAEEELRASRRTLRELLAHRESVKEEERKRIAREVHDELGQALTVLRMDVSLLRLNFGGQSAQLMERIQAMKGVVDRLIGIARHITSSLRPTALDLGLTAAIEWLAEDFIGRTGIRCVLDTENIEVVLDDSRATALFRIVQESMTNVMKHAEATEVRIAIRAGERAVTVEIRDNGKGFAGEGAAKTGSFGLVGIRERALMLGGEAEIQSAPGGGTRVSVCIPLAASVA